MTLEQSIREVENSIKTYTSELSAQELYAPITYIMQLGGKRLRPALAVLANQYFRGELEDIKSPALAVEVFHNFSLMHDDIMDNAPIRRGKATVHEKWNTNSAILSGDAMLVQAYQQVIKTNSEYVLAMNELFSKTALEVCEGQQMDMDFETRSDVIIPEYIEMIKLKTSVLIACALEMGAISAGASEADRKNIYQFGLNMGIAFQLRDDYLDAFGQTEKVGKQKGGDIISNKKTYLALQALNKADLETTLELKQLQSEQDTTKKVERTLELFKALGVDKDTEELSQSYYNKALQCLEETSGIPDVKTEFLRFSEGLMVREY
ncbi:MAG: polyprenyl synthetase family protein [Flavobacteriales bacterium]